MVGYSTSIGHLLGVAILLLFTNQVKAQYGTTQGLILLSGEVVDDEGNGLKDVHVQNMGNKNVTVTDNSGFFSIYLHKSHNLRFSAVGFRPTYFTPSENSRASVYKVVKLRSVATALSEITIRPDEVERATEMMIPSPGEPLFSIGFQGEQEDFKPNIGSPISALYNLFSKDSKQQKKLEELLKQDKLQELYDQRFERDDFWQLTGLSGAELEEFKEFCGMSELFVITATDYEFILRVKSCYDKFNN
jgi:hypothetical protein